MANIAANLHTYQSRVLSQNSHKKMWVWSPNQMPATPSFPNKSVDTTYQKTNSVQHENIFFQHSIHYILITITQNNKERNNHIISSNVAQKELKKK